MAGKIGTAMRDVVASPGGTARTVFTGFRIPIAGKTGTAEVGNELAPHSWFIGFAPYGHTARIAFAVIGENAGYGKQFAAPLTREIIDIAAQLGLLREE